MRKLIALVSFVFISFSIDAQKHNSGASYSGHIEYTRGNFGSFSYPVTGDSILVTFKDSLLSFRIFEKKRKSPDRNLGMDAVAFTLVRSEAFENIITPDKVEKTSSRDMKFTGFVKGNSTRITLYLTHYSDGSMAELTFVQETDGLRADDLFVAALRKQK
ncbi:MAG: hypothetical protein ACHQRM_12450 [Bacteroidia bacterium]